MSKSRLRKLSEPSTVKPRDRRNVLSFLVTSFFARAKKEVTRSSAGGVEALAPAVVCTPASPRFVPKKSLSLASRRTIGNLFQAATQHRQPGQRRQRVKNFTRKSAMPR